MKILLTILMLAITPFAVAKADMHDADTKESTMKAEMAIEEPAFYAVKFYADWCGSCKILDPELKKAKGELGLNSSDVLFVVMDETDEATKNQSAMMAEALGLGSIYKENAGKTGYVALINAETNEVVGKMTKEMKAEDMVAFVQEKMS